MEPKAADSLSHVSCVLPSRPLGVFCRGQSQDERSTKAHLGTQTEGQAQICYRLTAIQFTNTNGQTEIPFRIGPKEPKCNIDGLHYTATAGAQLLLLNFQRLRIKKVFDRLEKCRVFSSGRGSHDCTIFGVRRVDGKLGGDLFSLLLN